MSSSDCLNPCFFYSRYCNNKASATRKLKSVYYFVKTKFKQTRITSIHPFFVHLTSPLLVLFFFVTFCFTVKFHLRRFKTSKFLDLNSILIVNMQSLNCFIYCVYIYSHKNCQIKVFKCISNDTVTLLQTSYYLNIYSTF